jgi:hypothetical protein
MEGNGVSHKELNEALGRQTAIIIATLRRTEDSLKTDLQEVKKDFSDDVETVSDRVTYIERRNRWENFFASALAFLGAVLYGSYVGD